MKCPLRRRAGEETGAGMSRENAVWMRPKEDASRSLLMGRWIDPARMPHPSTSIVLLDPRFEHSGMTFVTQLEALQSSRWKVPRQTSPKTTAQLVAPAHEGPNEVAASTSLVNMN